MKRTWLKNYYSRHEIEPSSEAYIKKTGVYRTLSNIDDGMFVIKGSG